MIQFLDVVTVPFDNPGRLAPDFVIRESNLVIEAGNFVIRALESGE
ncbi:MULTISPECIES: hypothetical protein [Bhargavaea]|uniref:Uncharacterized protein n=1 Tax=Bhargavaea changchunensis TaxID=2134037 RepID=A0ABW2NJI9_9BACL|nr:hypothetical protein [Bhargavaea sp. CC-171006]